MKYTQKQHARFILSGPGAKTVGYRKLDQGPTHIIPAIVDGDEIDRVEHDTGRALVRRATLRFLNDADLEKGVDQVTPGKDTVIVTSDQGEIETLRVTKVIRKSDVWWQVVATR